MLFENVVGFDIVIGGGAGGSKNGLLGGGCGSETGPMGGGDIIGGLFLFLLKDGIRSDLLFLFLFLELLFNSSLLLFPLFNIINVLTISRMLLFIVLKSLLNERVVFICSLHTLKYNSTKLSDNTDIYIYLIIL